MNFKWCLFSLRVQNNLNSITGLINIPLCCNLSKIFTTYSLNAFSFSDLLQVARKHFPSSSTALAMSNPEQEILQLWRNLDKSISDLVWNIIIQHRIPFHLNLIWSLYRNFENLTPVTQVFWTPFWIHVNYQNCPKLQFGQTS